MVKRSWRWEGKCAGMARKERPPRRARFPVISGASHRRTQPPASDAATPRRLAKRTADAAARRVAVSVRRFANEAGAVAAGPRQRRARLRTGAERRRVKAPARVTRGHERREHSTQRGGTKRLATGRRGRREARGYRTGVSSASHTHTHTHTHTLTHTHVYISHTPFLPTARPSPPTPTHTTTFA